MKLHIAAAIALSVLAASSGWADSFPGAQASASNPVQDTYQETAHNECSAGACTVAFPATTHAKTLISHVSCFFELPSSASVFSAELASKTGSEFNFVGVEKYTSFSGFNVYLVNATTYLYFAQGEQPVVNVVGTAGPVSSFMCTVSGNFH
jgi:hypothetical protein